MSGQWVSGHQARQLLIESSCKEKLQRMCLRGEFSGSKAMGALWVSVWGLAACGARVRKGAMVGFED